MTRESVPTRGVSRDTSMMGFRRCRKQGPGVKGGFVDKEMDVMQMRRGVGRGSGTRNGLLF
jgi:hypothetical protein